MSLEVLALTSAASRSLSELVVGLLELVHVGLELEGPREEPDHLLGVQREQVGGLDRNEGRRSLPGQNQGGAVHEAHHHDCREEVREAAAHDEQDEVEPDLQDGLALGDVFQVEVELRGDGEVRQEYQQVEGARTPRGELGRPRQDDLREGAHRRR